MLDNVDGNAKLLDNMIYQNLYLNNPSILCILSPKSDN